MSNWQRVHPFRVTIREITADMVHWWVQQGGEVMGKDESYRDARGRQVRAERVYMRMPGYKWCHYHQNGTGSTPTTLHMRESDAGMALLFLMKFSDHVIEHTLKIEQPQLD